MKRILVLGSTGFIGKEIVKTLQGQYDLVCPNRKELNLSIVNLNYFKETDVFDVIVFAGGVPRGKIEKGNEIELMLVENFFKSINDRSSHFIFLSSLEIFGKEENIDAETAPKPINDYAKNKLKEEELIIKEFSQYTILRLPGIFGQNQDHGFIKNLMDCARTGEEIILTGNGENIRGFIWIEDIAKIVKKVIEEKTMGKINLINSEQMSLNQYVEKLENIKSIKLNKKFTPYQKSNVLVKTDFRFEYSRFEEVISKWKD